MVEQVLTQCKLWVDGWDLSGDMRALALNYAAELKDNTTFGMTTRSRAGGLKLVDIQHEGLWSGGADLVDEVLFNRIGLSDVPVSIGVETGAEGEVGYSFLSTFGEYAPGAPVGEMFAFTVSAESSGRLVRGTILHNAARTVSANGTAFQVGAVSASQKLYATLPVIAASGSPPTLDVTVESDAASGFPSAVTQVTFAQKTAIGSEWATPVAGAITDDWWRVAYTIAGGGPSFTFIVIIGIQT